MVVRLLWLSGRALTAQARCVLGPAPGDCRLFHFPLVSPHNIYFQIQDALSILHPVLYLADSATRCMEPFVIVHMEC